MKTRKDQITQQRMGSQVFLTYLFLSALGIIAVVIAWLGLKSLEKSHRNLVEDSMPLVISAYRLSASVSNVIDLLAQEAETLSEEELRNLDERIDRAIAASYLEIEEVKQFERGDQIAAESRELVNELDRSIGEFRELIETRADGGVRIRSGLDAMRRANSEFFALLDPQTVRLQAGQLEFGNVHKRAVEAIVESEETIEDLVDELEFVVDPERLLIIRAEFAQQLERVTEWMASLEDRSLQSQLAGLHEQRVRQLNDPSSVFALKQKHFDIDVQLEERNGLHSELERELAQSISDLVADADRLMNEDYQLSVRNRKRTENILILFDVLLIATPLVVFFLYLKPRLVDRLAALAENTQAIASENFLIDIDTKGNDELSGMARALDQFRGELIEKQSYDSKIRTLVKELQVYKTGLDQTAIVIENAPSGEILSVNDYFSRVTGYNKDEVIGRGIKDVIQSDVSDKAFIQNIWDTIETKNIWRGEICNRKKSGELFWVDATIVPIVDGKGELSRFLEIQFLITDKKLAEAELKASEERFRLIGELTTDGYWDWDLKTNNEYLSPSFKRLFGYQDHEMENHASSWQKIIHPDDLKRAFEAYEGHTVRGEPFNIPVRYYHKNGHTVWVLCRGVALRNSEGEFYRMVGTHTDISTLKQTEEKLAQSNRELEQFAFIASHDLQEPLRTVTGYVQLLEHKMKDQLDSDGLEFMGYIIQGTQRMRDLISDLLGYSRVGNGDLRLEPLDLKGVVHQIVESLGSIIQRTQARIDFHENDLPVIYADRFHMGQLFQNLIGNALKFSREGVSPVVEIIFGPIVKSDTGKMYNVSIRDNGIGIESEYFEKVFMIFQRLNDRQSYEGTGIGLAVCRRIVERHGGKLSVESKPGVGSTFHFTLPLSLEKS